MNATSIQSDTSFRVHVSMKKIVKQGGEAREKDGKITTYFLKSQIVEDSRERTNIHFLLSKV
jgi:hypothetical protein